VLGFSCVMASSGKMEGPSAPAVRRDPYEVLSVPRDSSDQEIKSAYRKLALKFVPPSLLFSFMTL
jgi:DnaJ-domain-containing protein 1